MASPDSLRQAIQLLHQALADHPDPQSKQTIATCIANLLKVQANDYQQHQQQQTAAQTLGSRLSY